jgi:hypothetical protein
VTDAFFGMRRYVTRCMTDGAFVPSYTRGVRAMGIPGSPYPPRFAVTEWLCLTADRIDMSRVPGSVVVFGEALLRQMLKAYISYYNKIRTHLSLHKDAPTFRHLEPVGSVATIPILGGLHHHYVRV